MAGYSRHTIQTMQLFSAVIKLGSFSAAGRLMGMTPSSVSRRIETLEAALGAQLISRTSRQLTLTHAGRLYYEGASKILAELAEMDSAIADQQGQPKGFLQIHARTGIGIDLISPALPAFLSRYPDLKVKLWLDEEWHDLIENQIDIAIRIGNITEPSLKVKKLFAGSKRILIASPEYLARHPPLTEPKDLQAHNCLTWDAYERTLSNANAWHFRKGEDVSDIKVSGNLFVNNADVLIHAAISHMGIALLPIWCVIDMLRDGRLVQLFPEYEATPTVFDHNIYAVFQNTAYMPRKVRVFLDFYHEHLHALPADRFSLVDA